MLELFLELFPADVCLRCGLHMTEINAERAKMVGLKTGEGWGLRFALWSPFFSALISVMYGPQWRQKFAGNTCLKIAQSGHRLDHGYSVDVRSGCDGSQNPDPISNQNI